MTTGLVLDASVALSWVFDDEASDYVDRVLDHVTEHYAAVPALWVFEVANGMTVGIRRAKLTPDDASCFVHDLASLDVRVEATAPDPMVLLAASIESGLTAYDAAYVALAQQHDLPLATLDKAMVRSARRQGVALF